MKEKKDQKKEEMAVEGSLQETITLTKEEWKNLHQQAAKISEYRDKLLRLAADFDNFRKRAENEKRQLAAFVEAEVLFRILPVLDTMEQILKFSETKEESKNLHLGIKLFAKEFHRTLNDLGLKPLELVGKPFDPLFAEAVEVIESDQHQEGTILSVLRTGYQFKDQVIRPALVRIAKRPSNAKDGDTGTGKD